MRPFSVKQVPFPDPELSHLRLPARFLIKHAIFVIKRMLAGGDDYDWSAYPDHYRAELVRGRGRYSEHLDRIEWMLSEGRIFIAGDELPLHPSHRCVWEAVLNLRPRSVAEVGMGGGRFLAGFRSLLDPSVELRGYDIEGGQLALFRELYPEVAATIPCALLDITTEAVPVPMDVVVASTVLMHIQRPDAYLRAIRNLVASARRAIVVMDNYATHDYVSDLTAEVGRESLYVYETGRAVAIVVSRAGKLGPPYVPLGSAAQLH